ncbi:MAG TPA: SPASM domain-containing protein [Polyangiales bacterium]|nr:SPASM domain-containing protein [Polyangiales bacterium]
MPPRGRLQLRAGAFVARAGLCASRCRSSRVASTGVRLLRTPHAQLHADLLQERCVALSSHLRLYPNGDVPTCQFNSKIVGNLRHQPFEELWRSGTTEKQRRWVRQCPGCWAECEVLPNAIYSGQLLQLGTAPAEARHSAARAKSSKEADAKAGSGASSGVLIRSSTP